LPIQPVAAVSETANTVQAALSRALPREMEVTPLQRYNLALKTHTYREQ
jgi:hypothetical protein